MEKLVHEIIDVSQLESFDFAPDIQRINLSNLVLKTIEINYYFIEEKQLKLQIYCRRRNDQW
ncbi:hypothetical protein KHA80_05810 [Anaerobacillus sp. HL2]|nr:hypothetical protein KHA80_05810 [Anaerobacillus sp. HL2]